MARRGKKRVLSLQLWEDGVVDIELGGAFKSFHDNESNPQWFYKCRTALEKAAKEYRNRCVKKED